jgi:phenylpropionate dioxygenase-like ring-hydroxylating dioxygenase large terminal subunit
VSSIPLSNLDSVLTSTDKAKGLPNEHYVSEAVFEEEKKAILFDNWSAIGTGKDIPNIGDVKPIHFVGMPLIMVRDENNRINVFQNTCRHRGMILIEEPSNISGVIRCPYHSWCYNLEGDLCATPMVGGTDSNSHESINNQELGLFEIRSNVWQDIIFVNISGTAPSFNDYASKVIERWSEFEKPIYHGGEKSSFSLTLETNWKLAVENYCESYHLPWVHLSLMSHQVLKITTISKKWALSQDKAPTSTIKLKMKMEKCSQILMDSQTNGIRRVNTLLCIRTSF